jgi:arylsulfatase A-like enzyme
LRPLAVSLGAALRLALAACGRTETPAPRDQGSPPEAAPREPPPPSEVGEAQGPAHLDLNVLLVTIDCLRADMPWAGYERPIAPRLTELARKSIVYSRAYSISSYTSMSLGGLLGGKLPSELRRDGYFFGVYAKDNVMFPELLDAAGIRTIAGHAHGYFHDAGFDQGFDRWEVVPDLKWSNTTDQNVTSKELEGIAERLLSEVGSSPWRGRGDASPTKSERFFAWFHFLDPHDQYLPHPGIGPYGGTPRDRYDAEVTFTDLYVGKLLDFVASQPWGKRTAILVTADHGEAFGEHHQYFHGFELWENLVRVPLIVSIPGVPGRRIDVPRSAVDLAPTVLELLGVPESTEVAGGGVATFEGKSLVGEFFGAAPESRDVVIDLPETSDNDRRRALVHGDLKLIAFGKGPYFQLFNLSKDPGELKPEARGEAFDEMLGRYRSFEKGVREVPPTQCKEGCLNGAYARKDGGR